MYQGGDMIVCALLAVAVMSAIFFGKCSHDAERWGRCTEICRPERAVEVVNSATECLCATKRVKLEKVP